MPLVTHFLVQIRIYVRNQDGETLRDWLRVEPNASKQYQSLAAELRSDYRPRNGRSGGGKKSLDEEVEDALPQEDDVPEGQGTAWPGLIAFMKEYMGFWRDVDFDDLLGAHQLLYSLVNACATAFTNPTYGAMFLQTSMSLCETLARLTMSLSRRPDLTRKLRGGAGGDEDKSIAESSAEIIQKIFTTCLTDRSSPRFSKPEGKKVGVYMFANLVLKLLFACRRTGLAKMIFVNISTISPPLSLYPAAQRVTFLYYLGRFNFANGHYLRASNCLQEAYLQTPAALVSHRTAILTYLIPCNILLGRFPSQQLLQRPEAAQTLAPVFLPLCRAIRSGNFIDFQACLQQHESWLFDKGLLLPLTHRLRPLLWRSLSRKVFVLTFIAPTDANSRKAATLDLTHLHTAAIFSQRRLEGWTPSSTTGHKHVANPLLMKAVSNSSETTLSPPPSGPRRLRPNEGLIWGNAEVTFDDVEMMVATLVQQGLMHGFVAHGQGRFAIIGAKAKGPVLAGWPVVWQAVRERRYDEEFDPEEVPGWVKG